MTLERRQSPVENWFAEAYWDLSWLPAFSRPGEDTYMREEKHIYLAMPSTEKILEPVLMISWACTSNKLRLLRLIILTRKRPWFGTMAVSFKFTIFIQEKLLCYSISYPGRRRWSLAWEFAVMWRQRSRWTAALSLTRIGAIPSCFTLALALSTTGSQKKMDPLLFSLQRIVCRLSTSEARCYERDDRGQPKLQG